MTKNTKIIAGKSLINLKRQILVKRKAGGQKTAGQKRLKPLGNSFCLFGDDASRNLQAQATTLPNRPDADPYELPALP